jgi:aminopeptidase N
MSVLLRTAQTRAQLRRTVAMSTTSRLRSAPDRSGCAASLAALLGAVAALLGGAGCSPPDPHSYANFDAVRIADLKLDLTVSFEQRTIAGVAELKLDWREPRAHKLALDTRDLTIEQVCAPPDPASPPAPAAQAVQAAGGGGGACRPLEFRLGRRDPVFGSRLLIDTAGQPQRVRITYRTSPRAGGLQWLLPEQTAGKKHPFLFSQSQAIHARSWVPIQDTPAVRFTYSARVRTPKDLLCRMSADNRPDEPRDGDYSFTMSQAIPSYLLAIAVGDLGFAPLGARSGIYAEPVVLPRAAAELADTEAMIAATERLYGPYRWGRYDLLVLPPSFPLGGMENPRLTFVTPTIIAGDKSLVSLIAHELAHSWSGNLVTNDRWNSFWLNEGFTSYVENRIVEAVYGRELAVMEQELSQDGLRSELRELAPADQRLRLNLSGRDPDRGMTAVAYDKGHWFLRFLEQRFGRDVFDPFLRSYFDRFAFQSIGTDEFLRYLRRELLSHHPGKVTDAEIRAWLEEPSIPPFAQSSTSPRFGKVDAALAAFNKGTLRAAELPAAGWSPQEWLRFLNELPDAVSAERPQALDERWQLTATGNSEIAHAWFRVGLRCGYRAIDGALDRYLTTIGRRKLIVPLYQELLKTPAGRERARAIYARARPGYHPIVQSALDALLR